MFTENGRITKDTDNLLTEDTFLAENCNSARAYRFSELNDSLLNESKSASQVLAMAARDNSFQKAFKIPVSSEFISPTPMNNSINDQGVPINNDFVGVVNTQLT